MSLRVGRQLGSVEITGLLGRGGMGEVYRARDTKLKREVAIKILPHEFSQDPEDPRQRLGDIRDARIEIEEAPLPLGDAAAPSARRVRVRWLAAILAIVLAGLLATSALLYLRQPP